MQQVAHSLLLLIALCFYPLALFANDHAQSEETQEALSQLDELMIALEKVKLTAHDFDKGRLQSLQTVVQHTRATISKESFVHLSVTDAYVLLTIRIECASALFEKIKTDENRHELARVGLIIQNIRVTRGFDREPRLHVLAANLKQLQETFTELRQLLGDERDIKLRTDIADAIGLIGEAYSIAKVSGDTYDAFQRSHVVYRKIESMYPAIRLRFANKEIAIVAGVIFEVNEALGKFSDVPEREGQEIRDQ